MVSENKQNRRYKQINFIGLQNNRHLQAGKQKEVHPLYSPELAPAGNPRTCDSGSAIDS
jgi:hypothetical protein